MKSALRPLASDLLPNIPTQRCVPASVAFVGISGAHLEISVMHVLYNLELRPETKRVVL